VLSSLPLTTTSSRNLPPVLAPFAALAAVPLSSVPGIGGTVGNLGNPVSERVVLQGVMEGQNIGSSTGASFAPQTIFLARPSPGVGIDFARTLATGIREGQQLLHRLWTNTLDRIFTLIDPDDESEAFQQEVSPTDVRQAGLLLESLADAELNDELPADLLSDKECSLPLLIGGAAGLSLLLGERQKKTEMSHWHVRRYAHRSRGDEFVDPHIGVR